MISERLSNDSIEDACRLADEIYPPDDKASLETKASVELRASLSPGLFEDYSALTNITSLNYWVVRDKIGGRVLGFHGVAEVNDKYPLYDVKTDSDGKTAWGAYIAIDPNLDTFSKAMVFLRLQRLCLKFVMEKGYNRLKQWTTSDPYYSRMNSFFEEHLTKVKEVFPSPFGERYKVFVYQLEINNPSS